MSSLAVTPDSKPHFTLKEGIIRYKGRIWVGVVPSLHQRILSSLHGSPIGGHSGVPVTLRRFKQLFAWTGLKSAVHAFVTSCAVCQQSKPDRARYPGLLQPLPVPSTAWAIVSLDFIEGLPHSNRFNAILVVVDKLTKYGHFLPLAHPFTALQVAQLYLANIYKLHGLPTTIISDRDRIFTSNMWQELFKLTDTQLAMSSAYHPQTDGQTE